jgi:hypothetical protein
MSTKNICWTPPRLLPAFLGLLGLSACGGDDGPKYRVGDPDSSVDTGGDQPRTLDELPYAFQVARLADILPTPSDTDFVVANLDRNAIDVLDVYGQTLREGVVTGGSPQRIAWDASGSRVLVVHGPDSASRLDVVDMEAGTFESIDLTFDELSAAGLDVCAGEAGKAFVLAQAGSNNLVLEVDLDAMEIDDSFQFGPSGDRQPPILYADDSLFVGGTRWAFSGSELQVEAHFDTDWSLPQHQRLAPDGEGILFPRGDAVLEYDPDRDDYVLNEYGLTDSDAYGANEMSYTNDGNKVVALVLDYDVDYLQVFDRATSQELDLLHVGPSKGTISYETELLAISNDDTHAYVYIYDRFWNEEHGLVMRTRLD